MQSQADELLALISTLSATGRRIAIHRSIHHLPFPRQRFAVLLLLPAIFNAATWWAGDHISTGWHALFEFWTGKLELPATVTLSSHTLGISNPPTLNLPSILPDPSTWWIVLILTVISLPLGHRLPERFLPLRYFIYFVAFIQTTALAFFATRPHAFPYSAQGYIETSLATGIAFIFVIPWIHALVYYIFDFSLLRKTWLTLLSLAFIAIALPFQTMVHAWLLTKFSLLLAPLLYFVFSILPLILACIGLYGWAMSWRRDEREMS